MEWGTFIPLAAALGAAAIAGYFSVAAARRKEVPDIQLALNAGFKIMFNQLQGELDKMRIQSRTERDTAVSDQVKLREAAQIEQSALHLEIRRLRKEIVRIESHMRELEALLRAHHIIHTPYFKRPIVQ